MKTTQRILWITCLSLVANAIGLADLIQPTDRTNLVFGQQTTKTSNSNDTASTQEPEKDQAPNVGPKVSDDQAVDLNQKNPNDEKTKALDPAKQKLVLEGLAALTKTATSAKDFTNLVEVCDKELKSYQYLTSNQTYIRTLIGWGLNRRGELRLELGFEFDVVINRAQAETAYNQAMEDFDRAIKEDPTHWKAYLNRGIVNGKRKEWERAARDFNQSITLRPNQTYSYFNLAEIESQMGNYEASLELYDQILRTAAGDVQAMNGRALALAKLKQFDQSLQLFDAILEQRPEDAWVLTNKADVLQTTGRWQEAHDTYITALKIEQSPLIYRRLAWLFATCPEEPLNQPEGALVLAKKSMSESRITTAAQWDTLAAAQAANGNFRDAMDSQQQAMNLEPNNEQFKIRSNLYGNSKVFHQTASVATVEDQSLSHR